MKRVMTIFLAALALSGAAASAPSKDEEEVKQFIQKMYAFSLSNFELATFEGRLNLKRHCELLKLFFAESLVKQPNISSGCGINELGSIRYPSVNAAQLSDTFAIGRLPKPVLSEPRVATDKAVMSVTTGDGRTIYFLDRSANEWRIVNVLLYERWPSNTGVCLGSFLVSPTPEQKKAEPKGCSQ
jgi:hypothetical protein